MTTWTAEHATQQADWWNRYAIDRLDNDGRQYDPRLKGRLMAADAQLRPAVTLAHPNHDQVTE